MAKYQCWKCHRIWKSEGSDFNITSSLCPKHDVPSGIPHALEMFLTTQRLSDTAFQSQRNIPIAKRVIGILGE